MARRCDNRKCNHVQESPCHESGRSNAPLCPAGAHPFVRLEAVTARIHLEAAAIEFYEANKALDDAWKTTQAMYDRYSTAKDRVLELARQLSLDSAASLSERAMVADKESPQRSARSFK